MKFTGLGNVSFETYRRRYADAYRDLEEADQPIPEQKKVLDFLENIAASELQAGIHTVHAQDDLLISFDRTAAYMASVAARYAKKNEGSNRTVFDLSTGDKVDTRKRSPDEWRKLTGVERKSIIMARREKEMKGKERQKMGKKKKDIKKKRELKSILKHSTETAEHDTDPQESTEGDTEDDVSDDEEEVAEAFAQNKRLRFKKALYRKIGSLRGVINDRAELDSHADNTIFSAVGRVIEQSADSYKVYGYDGKEGIDREICTVAVAYDFPLGHNQEGETIILIFHQAFSDPNLPFSLVNPNQLREAGATIYDTPMRYDKNSPHAMYIPDEEGETVCIPFGSNGFVSYFPITRGTRNWSTVKELK